MFPPKELILVLLLYNLIEVDFHSELPKTTEQINLVLDYEKLLKLEEINLIFSTPSVIFRLKLKSFYLLIEQFGFRS